MTICMQIAGHEYLSMNISKNGLRQALKQLPTNRRIEWWRHVTLKGQGRDPNIFKARYFENGSR